MIDDDPPFDLTNALPFDDGADAITPQKPGAGVLSAQFAYVGKGLTPAEFKQYVQAYTFGPIPPDYVVLHHTAIPSASWARNPSGAVWDAGEVGLSAEAIYIKRLAQLNALMRYYRDTRGWPAGPHLFIDDRWIWLFTPMADVGVHASQGNSYRDSGRRLHYSIGIEVIGYFEQLRWPAAVAQNVAGAVVALKQQLRTFDYIDKPWAGGVGSHRMYNKPQCPGSAIVPSYYLPLFKATEGNGPSADRYYRVKAAVTAGATIRAAPRTNAAVLGRLHAGDVWTGEPIPGQLVTIAGFGSSNQWIRSSDMRCVSSVLLEELPHRG